MNIRFTNRYISGMPNMKIMRIAILHALVQAKDEAFGCCLECAREWMEVGKRRIRSSNKSACGETGLLHVFRGGNKKKNSAIAEICA